MLARVETVSGVVEIRPAQEGEEIRGRPVLMQVSTNGLVVLGVTASELRQIARAALAVAEEVEAREASQGGGGMFEYNLMRKLDEIARKG